MSEGSSTRRSKQAGRFALVGKRGRRHRQRSALACAYSDSHPYLALLHISSGPAAGGSGARRLPHPALLYPPLLEAKGGWRGQALPADGLGSSSKAPGARRAGERVFAVTIFHYILGSKRCVVRFCD